jgi:hypothetical protein
MKDFLEKGLYPENMLMLIDEIRDRIDDDPIVYFTIYKMLYDMVLYWDGPLYIHNETLPQFAQLQSMVGRILSEEHRETQLAELEKAIRFYFSTVSETRQ